MAVKTKADVLVQLNLIVASLNTMIEDAVLPSQAIETKAPTHPLRQIEKLFSMADSGVFTVNQTYLDQMYNSGGTAIIRKPSVGSRSLKKKIA